LAEAARSGGALTVALVTTPFTGESWAVQMLAEAGLARLEEVSDTVAVFSLPQYRTRHKSASDSWAAAQKEISHVAAGLVRVTTESGLIDLDLCDIRPVLANSGRPFLLWASGKITGSAQPVIQRALAETGQTRRWSGATRLLLSFTIGPQARLDFLEQVAGVTSSMLGREGCETLFGAIIDPQMADSFEVLIVASGPELSRKDPVIINDVVIPPFPRRPAR
jgi:cell division protein FtsZ